MKFLKIFLLAGLVFGLFVWWVTGFLGPDDLAKCGERPDSANQSCSKADAIVAISGGDTQARAKEAIRLYQNGWSDRLIFSGAAADKTGPSNAAVMKQQAIDAGVDPNSIIIEDISSDTTQNAVETTTIFQQEKIHSAIIVTSAYHERRAGLEFKKRAADVTVRLHPVASDKHWNGWWWTSFSGWRLAMPELVASLILGAGGDVR